MARGNGARQLHIALGQIGMLAHLVLGKSKKSIDSAVGDDRQWVEGGFEFGHRKSNV